MAIKQTILHLILALLLGLNLPQFYIKNAKLYWLFACPMSNLGYVRGKRFTLFLNVCRPSESFTVESESIINI